MQHASEKYCEKNPHQKMQWKAHKVHPKWYGKKHAFGQYRKIQWKRHASEQYILKKVHAKNMVKKTLQNDAENYSEKNPCWKIC